MAANRKFKPLEGSLDNKLAVVAGRVAIGATGAVGAQTRGRGITVTRTAVGDYTLTLPYAVPAINFVKCEIEEDADVAYLAKVKVVDASAGTITLTVYTAAAPTTPADPPSGSFLHFLVAFCMSSATN